MESAEQGGKRRQHEALRPLSWTAVLAFSGSDATSDSMRRMERHEGHGARGTCTGLAPQDPTCRDSQASEAVRPTTARAEQGGKRRQHEALRPSSWKAVLAFSGSDATSDSMRRMERLEGHGAKNLLSTCTAGSDVQ